MMNAKARAARAHRHALREPDRPRRARQLLDGDRPRQARARPAPQRVLPRDDEPAARDAEVRRPPAHVRQPQHCSCATCRRSTASRPATRSAAGYILVGSASRARHHGRHRRPRRPRARRRATATRSTLLQVRPQPLPRASPPVKQGQVVGHAALALPRRAGRPGRRRRPSSAPRAAATSSSSRVTGAPTTIDGPLPQGRARRHGRRHASAARSSRACRCVTADAGRRRPRSSTACATGSAAR